MDEVTEAARWGGAGRRPVGGVASQVTICSAVLVGMYASFFGLLCTLDRRVERGAFFVTTGAICGRIHGGELCKTWSSMFSSVGPTKSERST